MLFKVLTRLFSTTQKNINFTQVRQCRSVFGLQDLLAPEKREKLKIHHVTSDHQSIAIEMIKNYYLHEHILVRARNMDLSTDLAFDEYLSDIVKQGNTMFAVTKDGIIAGICVGFVSTPNYVERLSSFAKYRQDPNTRDFLYFTAKLHETPNLWNLFKQNEIFEIKMLAVCPEYRRQGVATFLTENAKKHAYDEGLNVMRMDCINPYDYKVAERCLLQCIAKFPLHKLRGPDEPFIDPNSEFNQRLRVYVGLCSLPDLPDLKAYKQKEIDIE